MKRKWILQIASTVLIVAVFAAFNLSIYTLLTRRLANNFSDTSQAKMIDVARYLPFDEKSEIATLDAPASLSLTENIPVLDGAAALFPLYASIVNAVYPADSVTYEGGVFSDDNYYGENFAPDSKLRYHNTVRGYTAIVDGDTDILFCAAPSAEQRDYAASKGVELVYVPVGLEAFVFFVNEKNPVENLTADEIRKIYAGELQSWAEVGGTDRPINPVTRLAGSGSQSAMDAFMGDTPIGGKSPFAVIGASIGFSFRYYLDDLVANRGVKMLSLNGVYPSRENIANRSYPVVAEFYAIYRRDNENENIPRLIDWILSEEGQTLIERSGYTSIHSAK